MLNTSKDNLMQSPGSDSLDSDKIRKEKVKWKYMKDEEQRTKMLIRLKQKLELPEAAPELYDPRRVEEEREMIENAIRRSVEGERS
jgi:hypothetical protein